MQVGASFFTLLFSSKTCKNFFFVIPRKCASIHFTNGKVRFQSTPEKKSEKSQSNCKTRCIWYKKTLSSRNVLSTCFIPWGLSFPSYSQSKIVVCSAPLGCPGCGSDCRYLPYSIHFSEFMSILSARKQSKHENTRSLPFSYDTKWLARVTRYAKH